MPTPPKESIGGKKGHQTKAFDFAREQYIYITELEAFTESEDFRDLSELEQEQIQVEIQQQNFAYETLRRRVNEY